MTDELTDGHSSPSRKGKVDRPNESLLEFDCCAVCCALEDGKVLTFGDGSHGQLGHRSTAGELIPRQVLGIDEPVAQIACGRY